MRKLITGFVVLILGAAPAMAEYNGWGPHVGVRNDPDQVFFGAHFDLGNVAPQFRLQPNIDLGLGDNTTTLGLVLDGSYRFVNTWESWSPYLGGGLGWHAIGNENGPFEGDTRNDAGLSILGGLERGLSSGSRFFVEGRLGFIDAPEFAARVGWTFH